MSFLYNWAHSVKLGESRQVFKPKSEDELLTKIKSCNGLIKVLGSGMSFNGIGRLDESIQSDQDLLLDISELYSGATEFGDDWAIFGGATDLEQISKSLITKQLQIASCPGVLLTQTLAGALATGTHGQGMNNGGLYDCIISLRIILADGKIRIIDQTDPDFGGFQIHLGALGIITHVKLECEPLTIYRVEKEITDFSSLIENFEKWNNESEHCKAWWFPGSDHVQLWRTTKANENELAEYEHNNSKLKVLNPPGMVKSLSQVKASFKDSIEDLLKIMKKDTSRPNTPLDNSFDEARFRTVSRFEATESCIGNIYEIWCKGIPAPQVNCELAVPLDSLSETLVELKEYCLSKKIKMHYPFILRCTGSSNAWLSPSSSCKVCYIGFLVYLYPDDLFEETFEIAPGASLEKLHFLKSIEELLCSKSIPHFGKFFSPSLYSFSSKFQKWNDFKNLVSKVDPTGKFRNSFLKDLIQNV